MAPIPSSTRKITYSPVGSAGPFPVGSPAFPIFDPVGADLLVTLNGAVVTNWTFSGVLESGFYGAPNTYTGSITFAAPITGALVIKGKRAPRRQAQFDEGRGIPARDHNTELNTLTAVDQELRRDVDDITARALRVPENETIVEMPALADRASKVLGFDELGRPVPYVTNPVPLAQPGPDTVGTLELKNGAVALENMAIDLIRTPAYAEQILHFAAGGSNSNPGTAGSPLADGNEAWRILRDRMDGRGQNARLKAIGLNNVPLDIEGAPFGFRSITLEGSTYVAGTSSTWDDASFNAAANTQSVKVAREAKLICQGFKVQNNVGHGLVAWQGGYIDYQHIAFGQCEAVNGLHVWTTQGGQMEMQGDCLIQAGAGAHIGASHNGRFRRSAGVSFLQANVAWGLGCLYVLNAEVVLTGTQPVGGTVNTAGFTPTGKQFLLEGDQAVCQSYGFQVPLPGELAGTLLGEFRIRDPFGPKRLGSVITPTAISTTPLHDWNPVGAAGVNMKEVSRVRMSALGAADLTGLFSSGVVDGQLITLINIGSNTITLKHFNAGSIESSRFGLPAGADVALPQFTPITLCFDAALGTAGYWTLV